MAVLYHEVREEDHILKNGAGEAVFRGAEHALVARTYHRPGDRYKTYKEQRAMTVEEFLQYLQGLRRAVHLGPPVVIPNQRKSTDSRKRGRSVD